MQRYQVAQSSDQLCQMVGVPEAKLVAAAGLPPDVARDPRGVTAREYFAFWSAARRAYGSDDFSLYLGSMAQDCAQNSETAAFNLSPDVRTGLTRLAVFKPLICPVRARIEDVPQGVQIALHSCDPAIPLPLDFQALHPIFILNLIRACSGVHVRPVSVRFDGPELELPQVAQYLGRTPQRQPYPSLVISHEDAALPLRSQNAEQWGWVEPAMRRRLEAVQRGQTLAERVAATLIELLPAGLSQADRVCERMHLSKRSFQRQLQAEGLRFSQLLSETRRELAMGYLSMPALTIDEIAHLLAYREPNSFYRAFHSWTGTTPQKARANIR